MNTKQRLIFAVLAITVPCAVLAQDTTARAPSRATSRMVRRTTRRRDDDWKLDFEFDDIDSLLVADADTAYSEGGWCLGVTVDRAARTVRVTDIARGTIIEAERGNTTFTCPRGAAVLHRHFEDAGHVIGPSGNDRRDAAQQRVVGVVMFIGKGRSTYEYTVYGALPR